MANRGETVNTQIQFFILSLNTNNSTKIEIHLALRDLPDIILIGYMTKNNTKRLHQIIHKN